MTSVERQKANDGQRGIALATVLVFLVVLSLVAFLAAALTRTDVQVVNNTQNEKEAFFVAEAGITEALLRLELANPTDVTVDGGTFNAAITPNGNDPAWQALILFSGTGPIVTGSTLTTPTIQPAATRLAYSTASAESETLAIHWEPDGLGGIKRIKGKRILDLVSIGQSGAARRKITRQVTNDSPLSGVILDPVACPALNIQGSGSVTFPGGVQINGTCDTALNVWGSAAMSAAGPIDVVGDIRGTAISPTPQTGQPPLDDPLISLPVPPPPLVSPYPSPAPGTPGTALVPLTLNVNGNQPLQPGVYYGGISIGSGGNATLAPGIYIMAGGGFSVSANGSVTGNGVVIYNTRDPAWLLPAGPGAYGSFSFTSNQSVNLTAPTSGTYDGIALFQDRANPQPIIVQGTATGAIDGLIYAKIAQLQMGGGPALLHSQLVIGSLSINGGGTIYSQTDPVVFGSGLDYAMIAWQDY